MASKFKKKDKVIIIAGKEKGKVSEITSIIRKSNRVILSGVNLIKKSVKPSKLEPDGGIVQREASLHISNISHIDSKTGFRSKVGFKLLQDGKKARYIKKTGQLIDNEKS